MNKLISEWENYCEGKLEVDKSYFLGLFKAGLTDQEVARVLRYFPAGDLIAERVQTVLKAGYLGEYVYLQGPELKDVDAVRTAARSWLDEQSLFCENLGEGELSALASSAEILFADRADIEKIRSQENPSSIIRGHVANHVFMPLIGSPKPTFALIEAAYGIAADSYLAWYIAQPLLKLEMDLSKYFDFWSVGGDGVLAEDGFYVRSGKQ